MKFLEPFSFNQRQTLLLIMNQAVDSGISLPELHTFLQEQVGSILNATKQSIANTKSEQLNSTPKSQHPSCPECGGRIHIAPVNISKCTNIGGSWNSSLSCTNKECRWTELSEKTMITWRKELFNK